MIARTVMLAFFATTLALTADPRDAILTAEKAVATARSTDDANALDRLTSEDFLWIRPDGTMTDKNAILESLRAGRLAKYDLDGEQRIRIFGPTAVVTGARLLHQRAGDRKIMVTNVWVNKDGRWQRVSSQTAYFPAAGKK